MALADDRHRLIGEARDVLAIFRGWDAHVSPTVYPTGPEHHRHVPTWNHQLVPVCGSIAFRHDMQARRAAHDMQARRAAVGLPTRSHGRRVNGATA